MDGECESRHILPRPPPMEMKPSLDGQMGKYCFTVVPIETVTLQPKRSFPLTRGKSKRHDAFEPPPPPSLARIILLLAPTTRKGLPGEGRLFLAVRRFGGHSIGQPGRARLTGPGICLA